MLILVTTTADRQYYHHTAYRYDHEHSPGYVCETYQPANIYVFVSDEDFRKIFPGAPSWDKAQNAPDGLGIVVFWRERRPGVIV